MPTSEPSSGSILSKVLDAMLVDLESDETFDFSVSARVRDVISGGAMANVDMLKRAVHGNGGVVDEDS